MYDALTSQYTFACPVLGETTVRLSRFRTLERLPGAAHPAVYRIRFDCPCGGEHPALVAHDELDWAPLGLGAGGFFNLMTARGDWPWTFFCYPEERPRPIFPSAFCLLAPGTHGGSVGVAVRCPACHSVSVN